VGCKGQSKKEGRNNCIAAQTSVIFKEGQMHCQIVGEERDLYHHD
jgi:hypothetical protein